MERACRRSARDVFREPGRGGRRRAASRRRIERATRGFPGARRSVRAASDASGAQRDYPRNTDHLPPLAPLGWGVARAGLRSSGKGANRTPRNRAAWPPSPGRAAAGFPAVMGGATPGALEGVGPPRGRIDGDREDPIVTTMSSAEPTRRDFLYIATGAVGAIGAAATLVPLISQMNPDASTIAAGAPIEVDLAPIADGQIIKVFWRSKPIFIFHRTKKDIEEAQKVNVADLPDPEPDSARVKPDHDQWL